MPFDRLYNRPIIYLQRKRKRDNVYSIERDISQMDTFIVCIQNVQCHTMPIQYIFVLPDLGIIKCLLQKF